MPENVFNRAILCSFVLRWLSSRANSSEFEASGPVKRESSSPATSVSVVQPYAKTPMLGLADPRWKAYEAKRKLNPGWEGRVPIEFHGAVVDEAGQPVSGAVIELAWNGTVGKYGGDGVGKRTLTSDTAGRFSLSDAEGKGLSVRVSKSGYLTPSQSNMRWFEYAGFWDPNFVEPDRNNPITFKLIKRPDGEPTYRIFQMRLLDPPGLEAKIDLLSPTGDATTKPDIIVRIIRPPAETLGRTLSWSVVIEGHSGAELMEVHEEFLTRAPLDGYSDRILRDFNNVRVNADQVVQFYVRNRQKKIYAAVEFEMVAFRWTSETEPASLIFKATVNPNDSPNVHYDPDLDIRETKKRR